MRRKRRKEGRKEIFRHTAIPHADAAASAAAAAAVAAAAAAVAAAAAAAGGRLMMSHIPTRPSVFLTALTNL